MVQYSPRLNLETLFVLDESHRIVSTREPGATVGPLLCLIRSETQCAWACHASVPEHLEARLNRLAAEEPPALDFRAPPLHADLYAELLGGRVESGPAYLFPESVPQAKDAVAVADLSVLERHFHGWRPGELAERSPVMAIMDREHAVSVCFCARKSDDAAEAGVETANGYRARGLASRVTAAWAAAIRASGRTPIYSTSWTNTSSQAVARRLGLLICAGRWSVNA